MAASEGGMTEIDAAAHVAGLVPEDREGKPPRLGVPGLEPGILARSGLGLETIRRVARAAARSGGLLLVAPLADAHTDPEALVEAVREVARLRLRIPGLQVDVPRHAGVTDPWVAAAGLDDLIVEDGLGTASLARLADRWRAFRATLTDPAERARGAILLRRLDDLGRRTVFDMLRQAWLGREDGWPGGLLDRATALATAVQVLGERERWMKAFRQYTYEGVRRLVVIPTWQCELRCAYCFIPKQDGRVMPEATYEGAVELLLSTEQPEVILQFFGGEALLEWPRVRHAIAYADRRAAEVCKRI
jgi:hypothetical protein